MAGGGGTTTLMSIPENCTAKHCWSGTSYTWADCQVPQTYSNKVYIKIFNNEGKDITETCCINETLYGLTNRVQKITEYDRQKQYPGCCFYFGIANDEIDVSIALNDSSNSIGNIPMGELTFNGVQSVTYNGTDYTKLVVDGTSYPPPVTIISFTIDKTFYQAEEGMTWAEWVASSYNTGSFIISDGSPTNANYYLIKTSSYGFLQATDAIISGEAYIVSKKEK